MEQIFGHNIANLVDAVTKLEKLNFESEEIAHAEYFRKVVLAMAKDVRVILIKLADRLHNVLTLSSMKLEKQKKIALETMEIYVPIANKFGLHKVHLQLADESFKYLNPFRHMVLLKAVNEAQEKRRPIIEAILQNIGNSLKSNGVIAEFIYRQHSIYNLYVRMKIRGQNFNRIYDIFEIKIFVKDIRDCYLTLGVLHSLYQPMPRKFKDYIAIPKSNGYQSLHSTLMGPNGTPIQIHIRTKAMDEVAENGIISHCLKHPDDKSLNLPYKTNSWINNILDIQASTFSANEFLDSLKNDLSPGDIYVFTPKSKIVLLPRGSTALDFAYFIHSDVGNHCYQASVNQKLVRLNHKLHNGDIIKIITKESSEPKESWLSFVVSGKATSKIRQYFKEQKFDEHANNGMKLLNLGISLFNNHSEPITDDVLDEITKKYYPKLSSEEIKHKIGTGNLSILNLVKKICNHQLDEPLVINLSKCNNIKVFQDDLCLPLPGDKVLAKITLQGELLIHRTSCKLTNQLGLDNLTSALIINDIDYVFASKIQFFILNQRGAIARLSAVIADRNINIIELSHSVTTKDLGVIDITMGVRERSEVENLVEALLAKEYIKKAILI